MEKKCLIYVRVSTEEQKLTGLSPEVQLKQAKEEVVKQNLKLAEPPYADEGKSGTTTNREGLQALLARCKQGDISYVIVQDTSRLSRDTTDYLLIKKMFKDYGIQIISINQPMTNDDNDAYARFVDEVIMAANSLHPRVTSMKVKINIKEKFEFGWWPSWAPQGYKNIDNPKPTCRLDQKIIIPDPITGSLMREAFELFSTGEYSIWRLVQEMYKKGLTSRTGKVMSISSMQQILKNPFYYGLMRVKGKEKTGRHVPLISKQLFDQCQFVLRKHRQFMVRQRKHNFFLRGFLFCPLHNKWLTAERHSINSKKRNEIIYYHCAQKGGCRGSYIDSYIIERFIANEFKKLQFAQEFIDLVKKNIKETFKDSRKAIQSEKQALINKKKFIEIQRNTLEDRLLDKTLDRETFKRKHAELQGKIKALEDQITALVLKTTDKTLL